VRSAIAILLLLCAPAARAADTVAVMLTGDGGWRRIDREVTRPFAAAGVAVVPFDTAAYYRTPRTPEESAAALAEIIRGAQRRWQARNVVLIGYSRGADVLPFMINRLPPELRREVRLIALLGLEPSIAFQYDPPWTFAYWFRHRRQFAVLPEVEKLQGAMCFYGAKERDSLCPLLDPSRFTIVREPGGHHFGGRYKEIGEAILRALDLHPNAATPGRKGDRDPVSIEGPAAKAGPHCLTSGAC